MMASKQPQYLPYHMRELKQAKRRFGVLLGLLVVGLVTTVGAQYYLNVRAGMTTTVSGRVYNISSGAGYANVTVYFCNTNGTALTDATGAFHKEILQGSEFCARVSSFPYATAGLSGPKAVNNNAATIGNAETTYEYQVAGSNCFGSAVCSANQQRWDRNFPSALTDSGYDLVYRGLPKNPLAAIVPGAHADTPAPPNAPGNFQATVSGNNAIVNLNWAAPAGAAGIKGYALDRSVDQANWASLATGITATSYSDTKADFGVHYFYRVKAVDQAGNSSPYATTDATTGSFNGTGGGNSSSVPLTASSDDGVVTAEIPANAVPGQSDCTINAVSASGIGSTNTPLVAGPYQLLCKTIDGQEVSQFSASVSITYSLKGKVPAGVGNIRAVTYNSGIGPAVSGQSYDAPSGTLKFTMSSDNQTMVLADKSAGVSPDFVVALLLVVSVAVGLGVLIARQTQKSTYEEYLRRKYYNL
jgi:hypothetical protein